MKQDSSYRTKNSIASGKEERKVQDVKLEPYNKEPKVLRNAMCFALFLFVAALGFGSHAQAQLTDPCGCDAGLGKVAVNLSEKRAFKLAYLAQIDQKQWSNHHKGGGGRFSFGPLSLGGNYGQFDASRREYLSRLGYSLDSEQSRTLLYERVETEDWRRCKEACIRQQQGFYCGVTKLAKEFAAVTCSWRPEGVAANKSMSVVVNGNPAPNHTIAPNTQRDIQLKRDATRSLLVTLTLEGGSSRTITVSATPKIPVIAPPPKIQVVLLAPQYVRGVNVALANGPDGSAAVYGSDVLLNAPPYHDRYNKAEWDFDISTPGRYKIKVEFAAAHARPVRMHLNGKLIADSALWQTTCGWTPQCQQTHTQKEVNLTQGSHTIVLERHSVFPHIRKIIFERVD